MSMRYTGKNWKTMRKINSKNRALLERIKEAKTRHSNDQVCNVSIEDLKEYHENTAHLINGIPPNCFNSI